MVNIKVLFVIIKSCLVFFSCCLFRLKCVGIECFKWSYGNYMVF